MKLKNETQDKLNGSMNIEAFWTYYFITLLLVSFSVMVNANMS